MKKIYLLFTILMAGLSFAQTPVITMIADGDESGGTPKVLEIYANGTVDFTLYSLENQTNGNDNWGNTFDLSPLGTVTDAFVYVYKDGDLDGQSAFAVNFPSVTTNTLDVGNASVMGINGDDRVRIVETASGAVVDVYGVDSVDGSGEVWEYKDGYAKRLSETGPDPVFNADNWEFHNGELNNHGAVQDGTTFESIIGIGTYTPPTVLNPSLVITSPVDGSIFSPATSDVDIVFTIQNFEVGANGTGDGYIKFSVDGDPYVEKFDVEPITIAGLTSGTQHTVEMKLVDNDGNDLSPAVTANVSFEIAEYIEVTNLAELRNQELDGYYHYTGEAFFTAAQVFSSSAVGFVQDDTAGIAIYLMLDQLPSTPPGLYDGVTDFKGKLTDYNGVTEIVLTESFALTGNNETQEAQVITIVEYTENQDNYESELIKIENVTIDPDGDTEFQGNHNYTITDGTDELTLRTSFAEMEGVTIPTDAVNVTGIGGQYNQYLQILPRDENDLEPATAIATNNITGLQVYPNPVTNKVVYVASSNNETKQIIIYNILGKTVLSCETTNNQAIDISQLQAGVYMIKIIENNKVAIQKLMIK